MLNAEKLNDEINSLRNIDDPSDTLDSLDRISRAQIKLSKAKGGPDESKAAERVEAAIADLRRRVGAPDSIVDIVDVVKRARRRYRAPTSIPGRPEALSLGEAER